MTAPRPSSGPKYLGGVPQLLRDGGSAPKTRITARAAASAPFRGARRAGGRVPEKGYIALRHGHRRTP